MVEDAESDDRDRSMSPEAFYSDRNRGVCQGHPKVVKAVYTSSSSCCVPTVGSSSLLVVPSPCSPSSAWDPVPAICGAHQQVQFNAVRVPGEERGADSAAAEDQ